MAAPILIAYDGSPPARRAVREAAELFDSRPGPRGHGVGGRALGVQLDDDRRNGTCSRPRSTSAWRRRSRRKWRPMPAEWAEGRGAEQAGPPGSRPRRFPIAGEA